MHESHKAAVALKAVNAVKLNACAAVNPQQLSSETIFAAAICWKCPSGKVPLHDPIHTHTHPYMLSG